MKSTNKKFDHKIKPIAFYLPQFHPTPENDAWWGPGFTEWTNVTQAKPIFDGHDQPRIPGTLGYYDLRLKESIEQQIALAQRYGLYGFCIYYYWFSGKRILSKPLDVLCTIDTNFKFSLCWANESWSRRWDGSEEELLIKQDHDFEKDKKFIHDVLPYLKKKNYIEIDGKKAILIYRPKLIKKLSELVTYWKDVALKNGVELAIYGCETFGESNFEKYKLDGSVEFPPHNTITLPEKLNFNSPRTPIIYDFVKYVGDQVSRPFKKYKCFPTVITGWDNSPRRKNSPTIFVNSSPKLFGALVMDAMNRLLSKPFASDDRYLFINAWNEWAEGTYLEPDKKNQFGYLEALRNTILGYTVAKGFQSLSTKTSITLEPDAISALQSEYISVLLERNAYKAKLPEIGIYSNWGPLNEIPTQLTSLPVKVEAKSSIDNFSGIEIADVASPLKKGLVNINGWYVNPEGGSFEGRKLLIIAFVAKNSDERYVWLRNCQMIERRDVVNAYQDYPPEKTLFSGFSATIDISELPSAFYDIYIGNVSGGVVNFAESLREFLVS